MDFEMRNLRGLVQRCEVGAQFVDLAESFRMHGYPDHHRGFIRWSNNVVLYAIANVSMFSYAKSKTPSCEYYIILQY